MAEATWEQFMQLGMLCQQREDHENAITCFTKVIAMCSNSEYLGNAYLFRGDSYKKTGENEKAIADYKKAADYGETDALTTLKINGVNYTPQKPSSSSAPTSGGSSARPAAQPKPAAQSAPPPKRSSSSEIKIICPYCGFENTVSPIIIDTLGGQYPCKKCWKDIKI